MEINLQFYLNMKYFKKLKNIFIFSLFSILISVSDTYASFFEDTTRKQIGQQADGVKLGAGYADVEAYEVIQIAISAFLSVLGVIFLILMLVGGYKWMNAGGNEEEVKEALKTIQRATIGLIIMAFAYSITYFVFKYLPG